MADLILQQGIDAGYAWPILDGDQPADLTGWTVLAQVRTREEPSAPLLWEFTTSITPGQVAITWTAEESLTWAWAAGFADVVLVTPEGRPVQVVWAGAVRVDRVVSHG